MDPRLACDEQATNLHLVKLLHASSSAKAPIAVPETPVEASGRHMHKGKPDAGTAAGTAAKEAKPKKVEAVAPAGGAGVSAKPKKAMAAPSEPAPRKHRVPVTEEKLPIPGKKNILITSALPYVNNVPHLGNIIGCVLSADVYARFCRQRGTNCIYMCGTDEYGTATETKAVEEKMTPREVCSKYFELHKAIYDWFDISFDYFGRTSAEDPWNSQDWPQTQIAQKIFLENMENGNLVEEAVEQVFCTGCSKFLADRFIEGECPICHYDDARGDQCDKCGGLLNAIDLLKPRCKADKAHTVEVRTSEHMFLDLPKLEPKLREWIKKSAEEGKWTANSIAITDSWLASGLRPRCITRDLKWGTPVPHEKYKDKVFYVWFDAPIGYISITANYTKQWQQWWMNPENVKLVQFMGKDNIPFHTVIFPASLLGTGKDWTLLHHVSTTEYLNYESGKFSKSRAVGVFGDSAMNTGIPAEVWRYYLLCNRPEVSDSTFNWADFAEKNNGELLKCLGNLVQRSLAFSYESFDGKTPKVLTAYSERDTAFVAEINGLLKEYIEAMEAVKIKQGLKLVMDIAMAANKYMQDSAPWTVKKTDVARCATILNVVISSVRLISALAEPFMPGFTDKVCHVLNLPHMEIPDTFDIALVPGDHAINKPIPIFSEITPDRVGEFRSQFGGVQDTAAAETPATGAAAKKTAKPKAAGSTPKSSSAVPQSDAARIDLRVGKILRAWPHPTAEKLWCEEVDVGEEKPRMIASGLRQYYSQEQMTGRRIIAVCNLKPRTMVGFESQGMVLCASNADRSVVEFIDPPADAAVGERILIEGFADDPAYPAEVVNPAKKDNPWVPFATELKTNDAKVATYKGVPLRTSAGPLVAPTQANAPIS